MNEHRSDSEKNHIHPPVFTLSPFPTGRQKHAWRFALYSGPTDDSGVESCGPVSWSSRAKRADCHLILLPPFDTMGLYDLPKGSLCD
jgi:hypothetical protein